MDAQLQELIAKVRDAAAQGRLLRLRGGGTKDFWGAPLQGEVLDTRSYAGIVSYEPSELVVTARCGTQLAELEGRWLRRAKPWPLSRRTLALTPRSAAWSLPVCRGQRVPAWARCATLCWACG